MTCIIGYVADKKVYIGADSAGVDGYDMSIRADEKVFTSGPFIMGFTTSFRMGNILRYCTSPNEQSSKQTDHEYLCTTFIDHIMAQFKTGGFSEINNNVVSGGHFLLGYKGNLYKVESDFQVGHTIFNYDAIGCGGNYALGCLCALESSSIDPKDKIILALKAAEKFSAGVSGPFHILEI